MKYRLDNVATPWMESYGGVTPNLDYSENTMSEAVLVKPPPRMISIQACVSS